MVQNFLKWLKMQFKDNLFSLQKKVWKITGSLNKYHKKIAKTNSGLENLLKIYKNARFIALNVSEQLPSILLRPTNFELSSRFFT